MEFNKKMNKTMNILIFIQIIVVSVLISPMGLLFSIATDKETVLPKYPSLEYFLFYTSIAIVIFIILYGSIMLSSFIWLKFALKDHSKDEILSEIEKKYSGRSELYRVISWLLNKIT